MLQRQKTAMQAPDRDGRPRAEGRMYSSYRTIFTQLTRRCNSANVNVGQVHEISRSNWTKRGSQLGTGQNAVPRNAFD